MTDLIKRDDALALLDLIAGGEEYIDDRERLVAAIPTIDPATIDAETQAMGDAMLYGVGIMQGGKHINLQYFFAQPDPAAIREAALQACIEELIEERDTAREYAGEVRIREKVADDARIEAEAKLAKAEKERDEYKAAAEICGKAARTTLAELEGEPLGAEFEAVWDANKRELYEP